MKNGNQYSVSAQTKQYKINSVDTLMATPVSITQCQRRGRQLRNF